MDNGWQRSQWWRDSSPCRLICWSIGQWCAQRSRHLRAVLRWRAMATITSSVIVSNVLQVDSRRAVVEQHTDSLGFVHPYVYLCDVGVDPNTLLSAHATL